MQFQTVVSAFLGLYEFLRQGHCAAGWDELSTNQATIFKCRNECASRANIGYFAYRTGNDCACYFEQNQCPDDNLADDYNAYRIVKQGSLRMPLALSYQLSMLVFDNFTLIDQLKLLSYSPFTVV